MLNPNSFESLKNVLNHMSATKKHGKNENNHEWTLLICDGVPYTSASNLQDKYLFWNICKEEIKNMVDNEELKKMKSEHAAHHQKEACTFHNCIIYSIILYFFLAQVILNWIWNVFYWSCYGYLSLLKSWNF